MTFVDLLFPVLGGRLPTDHAYPLYAALARTVPRLHDPGLEFALAPVTGLYAGGGLLLIDPKHSRLRLRVPLTAVPIVLPVAGKSVRVMGQRLQFGVPQVQALVPSPCLVARTVTIKHAEDENAFLEAARRQLELRAVHARLEVPRFEMGPREGEPMRRVLRIKDTSVVCFPLRVLGLTAADSILLQELGLGGRRRMGGGLFLPVKEGEA